MKILHLSKENLKFSAAHFLIFDACSAERLHGHNYQVQIDFCWPDLPEGGFGFCVDFKSLKELVYKELEKWDEMVLLPHKCSEMKFIERTQADVNTSTTSTSTTSVSTNSNITISTRLNILEVYFRDRYYAFPKNEVVLLPIVNTSVELLSELLVNQIWTYQSQFLFSGIKIYIEETRGQGAYSLHGEKF